MVVKSLPLLLNLALWGLKAFIIFTVCSRKKGLDVSTDMENVTCLSVLLVLVLLSGSYGKFVSL